MSIYWQLNQECQYKPDAVYLYTKKFFSNLELLLLFQRGSKIHNTDDLTTVNYIYNRQIHSALLFSFAIIWFKKAA